MDPALEQMLIEQIARWYQLIGQDYEATLVMRYLKGELRVLPISECDFTKTAAAVGLELESQGRETVFNGLESESLFFMRLPSGESIGFEFL